MARPHALLSASSAARWLECTKAPHFEEQFEDVETEYAREGTAAHALAEIYARYMLGQISKTEFDKEKKEFTESFDYYSEEMESEAKAYSQLLKKKAKAYKKPFAMLETQLDYSGFVPEGFGTADAIIISEKTLEVIDLKYGRGVEVFAENNPQMMLYALGAYGTYGLLYEIDTIKMTIFQPRRSKEPSSWSISLKDLLTWGEEVVKPKAKLAFEGLGDYNPSESTCRWCKAKEVCKARSDAYLQLFDDIEPEMQETITAEEAGEILEKTEGLVAWLKDLETLVYNTLMTREVKGWKLVHGKTYRKITREAEALTAIKKAGFSPEDATDFKLKGITALEKMLGAQFEDILGSLIEKSKPKLTLVKESDKREAVRPDQELIDLF